MSEDLALLGAVVTLLPGVGDPTREAFSARRPVLVAELKVSGVRRWPGWAPDALAAGVDAAYAFPLDADELETALVFAESATELLLDGFAPVDGRDVGLESSLDATLGTNGAVYQAQGKVSGGRSSPPARSSPASSRCTPSRCGCGTR